MAGDASAQDDDSCHVRPPSVSLTPGYQTPWGYQPPQRFAQSGHDSLRFGLGQAARQELRQTRRRP